MLAAAHTAGDSNKIAYSKIKLSFILLSSGMFKEVFDVLSTINLKYLSNSQKRSIIQWQRAITMILAIMITTIYATEYNKKGSLYVDSALMLYPEKSFQYLYYNGLKNIKTGERNKAFLYFDTLTMHSGFLSLHQLAITTSTLSAIYIQNNQTDSAINLLIWGSN